MVINRKVKAGLAAGLHVILCVGETIDEREAGETKDVLNTQITCDLVAVKANDMAHLVIAYEPVWAIGTGRNATPDQAQEAHAFIRGRIKETFGEATAQALLIQYGGSVKPDNAASLMHQPDVDGALVGGASLKADQFLPIVRRDQVALPRRRPAMMWGQVSNLPVVLRVVKKWGLAPATRTKP